MHSAVVVAVPSWLVALVLTVFALALWTPIAWWLVNAASGWLEQRIVAHYRREIEELEARAAHPVHKEGRRG